MKALMVYSKRLWLYKISDMDNDLQLCILNKIVNKRFFSVFGLYYHKALGEVAWSEKASNPSTLIIGSWVQFPAVTRSVNKPYAGFSALCFLFAPSVLSLYFSINQLQCHLSNQLFISQQDCYKCAP